MSPLNLLHLALMFHLLGLALMAGTTFVDFVTMRKFWRDYQFDHQRALIMREPMRPWPLVLMAGIVLLILSGVTMMAVTKGVFGEQIWFRIKIGLVVVIVLNGLLAGRRWQLQLDGLLRSNSSDIHQYQRIRSRMRIFHVTQLALFVIVVCLSTFKFN